MGLFAVTSDSQYFSVCLFTLLLVENFVKFLLVVMQLMLM